MNKPKKAAPKKAADKPVVESGGTVKSDGQFVIAALGRGFYMGSKENKWSRDRSNAVSFTHYEHAMEALNEWKKLEGFPDHADVSPGKSSASATLDPGAKAALAQMFPRLQEVVVKGSPYTLLEPKDGIKPKDLTVAERVAIAERHNIVGPKLPKYAPKVKGMTEDVKAAKASAISQDMREKMEKVGKGAQQIMEKEEKRRAAEKKAAKAATALSSGKAPKKAGGAALPKGRGIGAFCEGLLMKRKTAEQILEAVRKEFPGAKTSMASIAWYRNKLAQEGTLPKD